MIASTCPYCGVGCGVLIETQQDANGKAFISKVEGDPKHPANFGRLCSKGTNLALSAAPATLSARLGQPMLRSHRGAEPVAVTWAEANHTVVERFAKIIEEHGPNAVAFYVSGQLLTEDYYVFNKLAKGLIGTNNIDSNSRLCMSSAVTGYKATLGADAPPSCYEDIDYAEVVFIAGSNTAFAHPVLYRRLEQARENRKEMKLIVVDPRRTDTAKDADLHLPILPGTDVALFQAMLHHMLWNGLTNQDYISKHTANFSQLRESLAHCTTDWASRICGVPAKDIAQAATWFAAGPTLSLYCQGLNQSTHGTDKNATLINLHLATGQIGKPGCGPLSLTGQPNAMGGREVGAMANLLSGHRNLSDAQDRAEVAALWGVEQVPSAPGKTAVEMFQAAASGQIKALWIACTNPAQSMPDSMQIREAFKHLEFVVVQEAFADTATTEFADALLPATTWGEKHGTVTNSERRISRVRAALEPFENARHDWQIAATIAHALAIRLNRNAPKFQYNGPEQIWEEHRATTVGRDLDISAMSYETLERFGPQQWPHTHTSDSNGRQRLYEDGQFATKDGRAKFHCCTYSTTAQKTSAKQPLMLSTGRLRDQWHGMSRTGLVGKLFAHEPQPQVELNQSDMARRTIADDSLVRLTSSQGSQIFRAKASESVRSGQAFVAMHWGPEFMLGGGVNALTHGAFDAISKQPELKATPCAIGKVQLPYQVSVFGFVGARATATLRQKVNRLLKLRKPALAYGICVPLTVDRPGLLVQLADEEPFEADLVDTLSKLYLECLPSGARELRYQDAKRGNDRRIFLREGTPELVILQGEITSQAWLRQLLEQESDVAALGQGVLTASSSAPIGFEPTGKIVCSCLNVSKTSLETHLEKFLATQDNPSASLCLANLQHSTGCATNCGSCLPEVKSIIAQANAHA
jgi:assimilatory nitrate reductase catalytic subunit